MTTGVPGLRSSWSCLPIVLLSMLVLGCGDEIDLSSLQSSTTPQGPTDVTISWTANREKAVNRAGGGYRVYYSTQANAALISASVVDVPYVSGALAPSSIRVPSLAPGTYFVKVVAYSSLINLAATSASSAASAESSIKVP